MPSNSYHHQKYKKRSEKEIILRILEAVAAVNRTNNNGITKLRIMYAVFISYSQLTEYLTLLVKRAYLEYDHATNLYRVTEEGSGFLDRYTSNHVQGIDYSKSYFPS